MTKILFVCHGNICRSPMAEFVMKDLIRRRGVQEQFEISSAATSTEEIGNAVYPPVCRMLASRGIDCSGKRARHSERATTTPGRMCRRAAQRCWSSYCKI